MGYSIIYYTVTYAVGVLEKMINAYSYKVGVCNKLSTECIIGFMIF